MEMSIAVPKVSLSAGLYIVATPIGNLKDITLRALEILQSVDVVICEDTRVSHVLCSHYGIRPKLYVYNDNDGEGKRREIFRQIENGQSIALISDAGTPLISDPGYKLVREAMELELYVTSIPGASSVITALTLSGIASNNFYFGGFFSHKFMARRKQMEEVKGLSAALVFFERNSRLKESLSRIYSVMGEREVAIVREITKRYEEVISNKVSYLVDNINLIDHVRGEIVVVISPPQESENQTEMIEERIAELLKDMSVKNVVKQLVEETSLAKSYIYNTALRIKEERKYGEED